MVSRIPSFLSSFNIDTACPECPSNHLSLFNNNRYVLIYPQGCDVCNHLSLFLCVADYDKLLPGEGNWGMIEREGTQCASGRAQHAHTCQTCKFALCRVYKHLESVASVPPCCTSPCRLEPLCAVHDCRGQQGPQKVQVLRLVEHC
jgi:hypothetical protein